LEHPQDNPELALWMEKFRKTAGNAKLVGFFDWPGQMSRAVMSILRQVDRPLQLGISAVQNIAWPEEF
jgi:hypothetical protein